MLLETPKGAVKDDGVHWDGDTEGIPLPDL